MGTLDEVGTPKGDSMRHDFSQRFLLERAPVPMDRYRLREKRYSLKDIIAKDSVAGVESYKMEYYPDKLQDGMVKDDKEDDPGTGRQDSNVIEKTLLL